MRRGTICIGMLKPQGSGAADNRILIGAYGEGPLPRIDAQGMYSAAVHLDDMSHVVVRDLELTNPGNLSEPHRGVYLTSTADRRHQPGDSGFIHPRRDRPGEIQRHCQVAAARSLLTLPSSPQQTQFDGVLIENNRIEDVGRSGIYLRRDLSGPGTGPGPRSNGPREATGVIIRGNTLKRLQGDAIVAHGTSGAVIEDNVVSVGNLAGRDWLSAERNCAAGIWTWNSNNTLIQRNEVSGYRFGQSETDGCDGTGFDIDNEQEGTIIQYNYSHDNEGGFILLCSDDEPHAAEVRYNLSVDDGKVINASPCKFPTIGTLQ